MNNGITTKISGIKCDNPDCDFADNNVEFSDYDKWLNKPCPKCGQNLLTEQDYETCQFLFNLTNKINTVANDKTYNFDNDDQQTFISINMDGTGNIYYDINKVHDVDINK